MKMKKVITSLICSASILSVTLPTAHTVSAATLEDNVNNEIIFDQSNNGAEISDDTIVNDDTTEAGDDILDNYDMSFTEEDGVLHITVRDKETNEVSTAEVVLATEEITVDGEEFSTFATYATSVYTSGVMKVKFDINPVSVTGAVATIAAMASIVTSLGASGVGIATFKSAAKKVLASIGTASTLERMFKNASLNGWYQYQQQVSGSQAKNINRKLYMRVGRSASYSVHNFGNGGWFATSRPY